MCQLGDLHLCALSLPGNPERPLQLEELDGPQWEKPFTTRGGREGGTVIWVVLSPILSQKVGVEWKRGGCWL